MLILIINEVFKEKGVKTMAFCKNCGNNIPTEQHSAHIAEHPFMT